MDCMHTISADHFPAYDLQCDAMLRWVLFAHAAAEMRRVDNRTQHYATVALQSCVYALVDGTIVLRSTGLIVAVENAPWRASANITPATAPIVTAAMTSTHVGMPLRFGVGAASLCGAGVPSSSPISRMTSRSASISGTILAALVSSTGATHTVMNSSHQHESPAAPVYDAVHRMHDVASSSREYGECVRL
jgi:hypothetical protein